MRKNSTEAITDIMSDLFPARPGSEQMKDIFDLIDHEKIVPWPGQPRSHITPEQVNDKRNSISRGFQEGKGLSKTGIEMALIARFHPDPELRAAGYVMLIEGELRWRACAQDEKRALPLPRQLPVNVRDVTEEEAWEIAAVTGVQRQEYTPVQEANILARMMAGQNKEKKPLSVREVAERLGKSKSWVSDRLILSDPDPDAPQAAKEVVEDLQMMVSRRPDTLYHAREVRKVADRQARLKLIQQIIEDDLSVLDVRAILNPPEHSEVSGRPDTSGASYSAPGGQTTGSGFDTATGAVGSSSGTASGNLAEPGSTVTSRSHTSGPAQIAQPKDMIAGLAKPAISLVAELRRRVREDNPSADYRRKLKAEIALLESHILNLKDELA